MRMGVPRLFSMGGEQKHTICQKNYQKDAIFLKKSQTIYNFGRPGGRGARAPYCPPLRHLPIDH